MASSTSLIVSGSLVTNYARIGHAAQQLFPDILQELITIKEPPQKLSGDVNANKNLSKKLGFYEWSMINDVVTKGYADFDIPLIYTLVRNLNLIPLPTKGWAHPTAPCLTEVTPGDDIERIRRFRNETLHRGNAQVTDTELSQHFTHFKDIAGRLETYMGKQTGEFVDKFIDLETCCMDEETSSMYIERLDRLKKSDEDCRKRLHTIEQDVDALKKRKKTDSKDPKRKIDEISLPESFEEVIEVSRYLDALRNNIVILVGIQGSGKSTNGIGIIKRYCKENPNYDMVQLSTTDYSEMNFCNVFGLFDPCFCASNKVVVFLDDLFGRIPSKYAFKEHLMLLRWVHERKDVFEIKILVTVQAETKACLEELFENDTLLSTAEKIHLCSGMYPKRDMLIKIGFNDDRSDNILRQMGKTDVKERIGFPALVSIFKEHRELGEELFKNTVDKLMKYLSSLKEGNNHDKMYFVILIQVLMAGFVHEENEQNKEENEREKTSMRNISEVLFGNKLEFDEKSIETITEENGITDEKGNGILMTKCDTHYSEYLFCFQHEVIRDFVFGSYKLEKTEDILTTSSLICIVRYFRPFTDTANEPFVYIDSDLYPTVASHIISIIQDDLRTSVSVAIKSVKTLCMSPLLQDKKFLGALMTECDQFKDVKSSIIKADNYRLGHKTYEYLEAFHFTSLLLYQSCKQLSMMYEENVNVIKVILKKVYDSGEDNSESYQTINILVKSAMEEVCKENNDGNVVLGVLWKFIIDKKVNCQCNNFLINAWQNQCPQTVIWLQENVKEPNCLKMEQCFLSICRFGDVHKASWIFEHYPKSGQNKINMYKVFEKASERKGDCLVKVTRIWQWEERILEDYKHDEQLNENTANVKKNFANMVMNGILKENKLRSELFIWANSTFIPHELYFDKTMIKKIKRGTRD